MATYVGDHRATTGWAAWTLADADRRAARKADILKRVEAIDVSRLTRDEQINHAIFARTLRDTISEYKHKTHLVPISNRSGFHIEFPELYNDVPLVTTNDYENYIARLADFLRYTREHIVVLREGIRRGYTVPGVILEGYDETIATHIVEDPTNSMLWKPFVKLPPTVPEGEHDRLRAAAREAISTSVVPAYREFRQFMNREYLPNCRASVGASALPGGKSSTATASADSTTLDDITPEEIHRRGLSEVARIRGEMDEIIRRVEFDGDFAEFVAHLRSDPRFYPNRLRS